MGKDAANTKSDVALRKNNNELEQHESVIADGLRTFIDIGRALTTIRDKQLYSAAGFRSFEKYCKSKWQLSRTRAYQLMNASDIATDLYKKLDTFPLVEAHMRPLSQIPAGDRQSVWDKIGETAPNGVITTKHVANVVRDYLEQDGSRYPDESCEESGPAKTFDAGHEAWALGATVDKLLDRWPADEPLDRLLDYLSTAVELISQRNKRCRKSA